MRPKPHLDSGVRESLGVRDVRMALTVLLASPRGFCAGVERALDAVDQALSRPEGRLVYVRHEIVHNGAVVERLKSRGATFVEDLSEVSDEAVVVFSAHGVLSQLDSQEDGAASCGQDFGTPCRSKGTCLGRASMLS